MTTRLPAQLLGSLDFVGGGSYVPVGDQLLVVVVYHPLGSIPGRFRIVVPCGLYGSGKYIFSYF